MIRRSAKPIARNVRPKAKRAGKRRVSVVRDRGYLDFLKDRQCLIRSLEQEGYPVECIFAESSDPAHGPVNGSGSKGGDDGAISLCRFHHQESHQIGQKAFCEKYGFDWMREAAALYAVYRSTP